MLLAVVSPSPADSDTDVDRAIDRLGHASNDTRQQAFVFLLRQGRRSLPKLTEALDDDDPERRSLAEQLLNRITVPSWAKLGAKAKFNKKLHLPTEVTDKRTGIELVLVPPGTFTMGASKGDRLAQKDEKPAHKVTITRPFYMGKYEVTCAQWFAWRMKGKSVLRGADNNEPVTGVSWNDVVATWLKDTGLRLPTEAEWEYACRAGTTTPSYGRLDEIAWHAHNSHHPHKVGRKLPNAFGLYDMLGNVSEWCSDWYGAYPSTPQVDPTGPVQGSERVIRGRSYMSGSPRCSSRVGMAPGASDRRALGFRVARTP
jgi:formylglycine-generating enzyme required for sulfatase activity